MIVLYWCNKNVTFECFLRQTIGIPEVIRGIRTVSWVELWRQFEIRSLCKLEINGYDTNLNDSGNFQYWLWKLVLFYQNVYFFTVFAGEKLLKFRRDYPFPAMSHLCFPDWGSGTVGSRSIVLHFFIHRRRISCM